MESLKVKSLSEGDYAVAYGYLRLKSQITMESNRFFFCGIRDNSDCHAFIKPCDTKIECKDLEAEFKFRLEQIGIENTLQQIKVEWEDFLHAPTPIFDLGPEGLIQKEFKEKLRKSSKHFETLSVMANALRRRYEASEEKTPKSLVNIIDITNQIQLISFIENDSLTSDQMESFLKSHDSNLAKSEALKGELQNKLNRLADKFKQKSKDVEFVKKLNIWLDFMKSLKMETDIWKLQNIAYHIATHPAKNPTEEWTTHFESLLERLNIHIPQK